MRRCFWHLVEQKFDMITAPFKQGSSQMKVFKHLKGWINQLATHPETVEEHNFCKKEMLNWFSSSKIRNLVGSALVNSTLFWMNTSLFVHKQCWARVSCVNVPTFKNKCSSHVVLTWMIVIQSVQAPTMNTQAWMDGLSTALAS